VCCAAVSPASIVRKKRPAVADQFTLRESRYARGVPIAATVLVALVAVEHIWFAILEMVLWTKPLGLKTFQRTEAQQKESAVLAMNQGLYNLFLVAGLAWSLVAAEPTAHALKLFFLGCVVVAGVFGGLTVNKRIMFLQAGPAALGLVATLLAGT
jgi:putative membrane protein